MRRRTILKMSIRYGFMDIMGNMDRMVDIVHYGPFPTGKFGKQGLRLAKTDV